MQTVSLPDQATLERVGARGNTADLDAQPFYRFIQKTYGWHVVAMFGALYAAGGLPALVWGGALRAVWVYHITWFVNSASHCWGYQARARSPWDIDRVLTLKMDAECCPKVPGVVVSSNVWQGFEPHCMRHTVQWRVYSCMNSIRLLHVTMRSKCNSLNWLIACLLRRATTRAT